MKDVYDWNNGIWKITLGTLHFMTKTDTIELFLDRALYDHLYLETLFAFILIFPCHLNYIIIWTISAYVADDNIIFIRRIKVLIN